MDVHYLFFDGRGDGLVVFLETFQISFYRVLDVLDRFLTRFSFRDASRQGGAFGGKHPILVLFDDDSEFQDLHLCGQLCSGHKSKDAHKSLSVILRVLSFHKKYSIISYAILGLEILPLSPFHRRPRDRGQVIVALAPHLLPGADHGLGFCPRGDHPANLFSIFSG